MNDWNPDQYRKFSNERELPFWELVDLVDPAGVDRMVDLGCGDGKLTVDVADRLCAGSVLGIDSSPAMVERASRLADPARRVRARRHR